jgi:prepilin-type N-terminal cleavage/methylation domain-containing protein
MEKNLNQNIAFTLVELIVVITILSILATIGFLSLLGYQKSARESIRLSDIKLIEKQLSLYEIKNSTLPIPDNYITITASGILLGLQ